MTLRMIEGFDYLPANPSIAVLGALGWSGEVDIIVSTPITAFSSGRAMGWEANNVTQVYKFLRDRYQSVSYIFGLRLRIPTTGDNFILQGVDTSSTRNLQWDILFDQFGTITFRNYNSGSPTIWARTDPWVFVPGNWFYLEIKVTPSLTTGAFELKVNTVPVLSLVSTRTSDGTAILPATAPGISHLGIRNPSSNNNQEFNWLLDDIYFLTVEGSVNNDYLGNVRVRFLPVVGNSTPLDWLIGGTAPAPTNWQSVVNLNLDDTTYVTSDTTGDEDFYDLDPILNTPTVYGVEVGGAYKQDDATQRFVANQIRSGAVTETGSTLATNQSYTFSYDIYELNPETGLGWSGAEVNALKVGPKVIG